MKIEKDNVGREYVDIKTAHGAIRITQDAWGKDYGKLMPRLLI